MNRNTAVNKDNELETMRKMTRSEKGTFMIKGERMNRLKGLNNERKKIYKEQS